ncbi:MAG TPA: VWA domain-containing protein [Terriglobia bacterium]|nr:VWA domain-containing protein [Terriglobia bacterium]
MPLGGRKAGRATLGVAALLAGLTLYGPVRDHGVTPLAAAPAQNAAAPEISTQQTPAFTLRTERNLVLVRVVVRDNKGQVIGNLHKEDFRLLDNGKPQVISQFATEGAEAKPEPASPSSPGAPAANEAQAKLEAARAQRFIALYYDDVHTVFEDVARTRQAAEHFLASSVQSGDRVGVFTSSGQVVQDFTDSRDKLDQALLRLRPRPVVTREIDPCPDISPYQAHLMIDQNDSFAIDAGAQSVIVCQCAGDPNHCPNPQQTAMAAATHILNTDEMQSEYSLRGLEALVRRMALSPGQRNIVVISPGFLSDNLHFPIDEVIDRALRVGVVINALDSRGLATLVPGGDATHQGNLMAGRVDLMIYKNQYDQTEFQIDSDVMAELAASTGGVFFHNSNDYDGGFRKVAAAPGVYYVLAFSPENLKYDGKFHKLKVDLVEARGLSLQARRGYYAPRKALDPKEQADYDIKEAVFSQETLQEMPVEVRTQFFKTSDTEADLSVLAHLDIHALRFRKDAERNVEDLTFISAVFDRDGNFVDGQERQVTLRLRDGTLAKLLASGITIKTSFKVKPGDYMVREVVRDAEGGHLSGLSKAVEIPF